MNNYNLGRYHNKYLFENQNLAVVEARKQEAKRQVAALVGLLILTLPVMLKVAHIY